MKLNKKICIQLTIFIFLIINCSPKVYSLDECYKAHDEYQEELSIPLTELVLVHEVHEDIRTGKIGALLYEQEVLGDREIVPLSASYVTGWSSFSYYRMRSLLLDNYQNIEKIHPTYFYGKHIDKLKELDTPYLMELKGDEKLFYFYYEGSDLLYSAVQGFYSTSKSYGENPYVSDTELLYEIVPRENVIALAFIRQDFSKERYENSLNETKKITNDYSYFFTEHPECVDIPDFVNLPNVTKSLYSKINNEIEKMQLDENKYPSNIDWLDLNSP